ncbi:MAG TPA: right-handed parallel beta-helix repeat-containing protein [Polyangiaceae bacterium]|nr:right-handed parallel beta-helix repeat-containing protein [Polyangiaceae bacterium]
MTHVLPALPRYAPFITLLVTFGIGGCGGSDCEFPAAPEGTTVYVCEGADGEGTSDDPYGSLALAVDEAPDGANVLVSAGTFAENVTIRRAVKIIGSLDTVIAAPAPHAIIVDGASGVSLQSLHVLNPTGAGIWLKNGAVATVVGSHIEGAKNPTGYGVVAVGSSVTLQQTMVTGSASVGVYLVDSPVAIIDDGDIVGNAGGGVRADRALDVQILHSELANNADFGVLFADSVGIIDDGKITGTEQGSAAGDGVIVIGQTMQSNVQLLHSLVEDNDRIGVLFTGDAVGIIDDGDIVANGTTERAYAVTGGAGIWIQDGAGALSKAGIQITNSVLRANHWGGIALFSGAHATVSNNQILDTQAGNPVGILSGVGIPGDGIGIFNGSIAVVEANTIDASARAGIFTVAAGGATTLGGNTLTANQYGIVLQDQTEMITLLGDNTYGQNAAVDDVTMFGASDPNRLSQMGVDETGAATALEVPTVGEIPQ